MVYCTNARPVLFVYSELGVRVLCAIEEPFIHLVFRAEFRVKGHILQLMHAANLSIFPAEFRFIG